MLAVGAATIAAVLVALGAAAWAGLFALGEEAAVSEALHTLGDAPPSRAGTGVPLHRTLHVARLALLVLAGAAAGLGLTWWDHPWHQALADLALAAGLLFVLGDALPRSLARLAPELAEAALPLVRRTLTPFRPLLALLGWTDRALHAMVTTPAPTGPDLGGVQRDMLLGVFTLADTTVSEAMTPRLDMVAVDIAASFNDVLQEFQSSAHSRLPVYDGTADTIVGILFAKDVAPLALGLGEPRPRWQDLVRGAAYVPESKTLDSQLRDFQRGAAHLAIVVDEFGGTSGLITLEDVLEEVVGEIRDEHDVETPPPIVQEGERYWIDGRVTLDELSVALGRSFERPDVSTVGGLIYSALGHVPRAGEELTLDGYRVVVEQVDRRRVVRVYFEKR